MSYNPDQYTEPQAGLATIKKEDMPTTDQQSIIDQVADWIDRYVIAETIAEELIDQGHPITFENAKKVWLDVLENLHAHLEVAVDRVLDRNARLAANPVKVCCRTCEHCDIPNKTCEEGGHTDIGDIDRPLTPSDCNAWRLSLACRLPY